MSSILSKLQVAPWGELFGRPAASVYVPQEVFSEYHLKAFNCNILGDYLEITRFVVSDKGCGHGTRLLADLDQWAKERGLRLCLSPQPYYESSVKASRRLISFYKRNGFVFAEDGQWCPEVMYRP